MPSDPVDMGSVPDRPCTGFFLLGKMIEFNTTNVIFQNPTKTETEDYVTGRFG